MTFPMSEMSTKVIMGEKLRGRFANPVEFTQLLLTDQMEEAGTLKRLMKYIEIVNDSMSIDAGGDGGGGGRGGGGGEEESQGAGGGEKC